MKQEILKPNYNHSILNLITSILNNYGAKNNHDTLPILDKILEKKYRNVVLVILDGMGTNVLKSVSENGIFSNHTIDTLTSVFPCTTTAALTTYYSGKAPIETGWIGWSQYFKEYGRTINMLPYIDSYTGEQLPRDKFDVYKDLEYITTYEQIEKASPNVKTFEIKPAHCEMKTEKCIHIHSLEGFCDSIETLCRNNEDKYVFAYFDSPDSINHKYGCDSKETKEFILKAEKLFKKLENALKGTDTLIIMSADHGHNNIHKTFNMIELHDLQECLYIPPFLEPRFISFFVKQDKKDIFVSKFNEKFGEDFILYEKQEFLNSHLMGYGTPHRKVDDFIGDYIAISVSDVEIKLGTYMSKDSNLKLSDHCGLTKNEMEVPLIVFDLK